MNELLKEISQEMKQMAQQMSYCVQLKVRDQISEYLKDCFTEDTTCYKGGIQ